MKVLNFDGTIYEARAGSASQPGISFAGDSNTGIYSPGADQLAISTNGTGRLFVDASGNVSIGGGIQGTGPFSAAGVRDAYAAGIYTGQITAVDTSAYNAGPVAGLSFAYKYDAGDNYTIGATIHGIKENATNGNYASALRFTTRVNGSDVAERLRITSTGTVNIVGAGTAGSTQAVSFNGSAPVNSLVVDSSGRCGIGTSSPTENLTIYSASSRFSVTGPSGSSAILLGNQNSSGANNPSVIEAANGALYFGGGNSWSGGGTFDYTMTLTNDNKVGIGATTPGTYNANLVIYSAGGAFAAALHSNAGTFPKVSAISLGSDAVSYTYTTGGTTVALTGSAHIAALQSASSGAGTDIAFINTLGGVVSERARIDSSGRLLVGTSTSPSAGNWSQYALIKTQGKVGEIFGPGILNLARGEAATAITADENIGGIAFSDQAGNEFALITCAADANAGSGDYPGRLVFSTTADGASFPTERLRITSDGAVLCGKTSTSATAVGGVFYLGRLDAARDDGDVATFKHTTAGNTVGSISITASATAYNTSSDYRLKENVTAVTDGIARLQQLKPSRFNFITDPDKTVDGFIAHEVQDIVPEAITGEKDAVDDDGNPVYQGIDQSKLVPLLTAALQEAVAKIESLEARIAALESA